MGKETLGDLDLAGDCVRHARMFFDRQFHSGLPRLCNILSTNVIAAAVVPVGAFACPLDFRSPIKVRVRTGLP